MLFLFVRNFKQDSNLGLKAKLLILQKSLVRIICNANRISHADPLFHKLNTLKIDDLYEQSIRIFSFQLYRNILPPVITSLFPKVNHGHNTRGSNTNMFVSRSDRRSIKAIAPKCWNSLSLELRNSPSISVFKKRSKSSFINDYSKFSCAVPQCKSCLASQALTR